MNISTLSIISAVLMGLGATLTFDLWALFLKRTFGIAPSNICLVGRWLRYMPEGTFTHSNIMSAPQEERRMHRRLARPLHDRCHVRHRVCCTRRQQLASVSNADSRSPLRGRHGLRAILHHAAFIRTWIRCIKDGESYAGKTAQLDESHCLWRRSLRFCGVGQLVALGIGATSEGSEDRILCTCPACRSDAKLIASIQHARRPESAG